MENIYVIGASGHAKVVIDILRCMKKNGNIDFDDVYLLDDNEKIIGSNVMGCKVIGKVSDCEKYKEGRFIIAIGNNKIRRKIACLYELNYIIAKHPSAVIAADVEIQRGTVLMAGAVVNSGSKIGRHCIINTGATVDHDSIIEDYVHISPGVHMGGTVHIGQASWIGVGSSIINNIKIGQECIVGAGTVVIRNIKNECKVVGNPARMITNE